MRFTFLIAFVFELCSCFQTPKKSSYSSRTALQDHHYFYIDAYSDIKNALIPHDVYSTVAAETANIFVRTFVKRNEKQSAVNYKVDSVLYFGCFFLGIPQTFNPLIISLLSIDLNKDYKKETICTFVGISKWLIYNKLIRVFGLRDEEIIVFSSFVATSCATSLKYLFTKENYKVDVFFQKEMTQILCFENTKQLLEYIYPLDAEMPFAALVDELELDCSQLSDTSK